MSKRQREKDEREMANNCIVILGEMLTKHANMEFKRRKDNQPYLEFVMVDKETGKKKTFMRVDVLCRIFEV